MQILDRQRYWSYIKAYVICYFSLVGLYIVIDAFSNLDEGFCVTVSIPFEVEPPSAEFASAGVA